MEFLASAPSLCLVVAMLLVGLVKCLFAAIDTTWRRPRVEPWVDRPHRRRVYRDWLPPDAKPARAQCITDIYRVVR